MRIAKFVAQAGLCSRREAEKLLLNKKIMINSIICKNPATKVNNFDVVEINGKKITINNEIRLWKFYKPRGLISTTKDPKGRKTIFDILPKSMPRVISIGRLDINSEGLILLTNNGDLSRFFELPKNKIIRKYKVRVRGIVNKEKLISLKNGITIDQIIYKSINAKLIKQSSSNAWIHIILNEGKNREIRKICSHFGWNVNKLIRIEYGNYSIKNLKPGQVTEIKNNSLRKFLDD